MKEEGEITPNGAKKEEEAKAEEEAMEFMAMPRKKAAREMFPPGCQVYVLLSKENDEQQSCQMKAEATVKQVGINLESEKRENLYEIELISSVFEEENNKPMIVTGEKLLFAPPTAVWLTVPYVEPKQVVEGEVVGAEFLSMSMEDLDPEERENIPISHCYYSVKVPPAQVAAASAADGADPQQQQQITKVYHGVAPENLKYRSVEAAIPRVKIPQPQMVKPGIRRVSETSTSETFNAKSAAATNSTISSPQLTARNLESKLSATLSSQDKGKTTSGASSRWGPPVEQSPAENPSANANASDNATTSATSATVSNAGSDTTATVSANNTTMSATSPTTTNTGLVTTATEHFKQAISSTPQKESSMALAPKNANKESPTGDASMSMRGSTTTTTKSEKIYSKYAGGFVESERNTNPTKFRMIRFGEKHDFKAALDRVRCFRMNHGFNMHQYGGVGKVIFDRCLPWQLRGLCNVQCKRREDHITLDEATTRELEEAFRPAMGIHGPILCYPAALDNDPLSVVADKSSSSFNKRAASGNMASPIPPSKRTKLEFWCQKSDFDKDAGIPISMKLPSFFGEDFLLDKLVGSDGAICQYLCDKYTCSIRFSGRFLNNIQSSSSSSASRTGLVIELKSPDLPNCFECRKAVEDILFHATPVSLRGALLYHLGALNNYRQKTNDFIHTRNPFSEDADELVYVTLLKAGFNAVPKGQVISYDQADRWTPALLERCPGVQLNCVRKPVDFPKLFAHIILGGADLREVAECRATIHEWIKYEAEQDNQY